MKKIFINSILVLGAFFVVVIIIEVFLRLLGWGQIVEYQPDEQWGYLMKPSQTVYSYGHPVHINKFGLRGPEIQQNKREGVVRILFLGDSITYGGNMIKEEELFCRKVESLFNNNGKVEVESINLSASGWSPKNWMKYIILNGFFEADIIIPILTENDLTQEFSQKLWHKFPANQPTFRVHTVLWKMKVILESILRNKDHWAAHKYSRWLVNNKHDGSDSQSDNVKSSIGTVKLNTDTLLQLINLCKINNIELLPVFIPSKQPTKDVQMIWAPFEKILSNPLDLRDELNDDSYFMDNVHMTVKGHKLVGEKIYDRVNEYLGHSKTIKNAS